MIDNYIKLLIRFKLKNNLSLKKALNDEKNSSQTTSKNQTSNSITSFKRSQDQNSISNEVASKGSQTNETAFVPCSSCAKVQKNLEKNADQLINMCHYRNIISNIGKYRSNLISSHLIGGWLNGDGKSNTYVKKFWI